MASQTCHIGLTLLSIHIPPFISNVIRTTLGRVGTCVGACGLSAAEGIPRADSCPAAGQEVFPRSRSEEDTSASTTFSREVEVNRQ